MKNLIIHSISLILVLVLQLGFSTTATSANLQASSNCSTLRHQEYSDIPLTVSSAVASTISSLQPGNGKSVTTSPDQCNNSELLSPTANFWWLKPCQGSSTLFEDLSTTQSGTTITSWNWNFGDPASGFNNVSTSQNPTHTYATAGVFSVFLAVTNSLGETSNITKSITIYESPTSAFVVLGSHCLNQMLHFDDQSTTPYGYINVWDWDFGDGHVARVLYPANPDVSHKYSSPGTYTVSLRVQVLENQATYDSCSNTSVQTITINIPPQANFNYSGNVQNQPVQFTDASVCIGPGTMTAWNWDFGDPASGVNNTSSLQNPAHTYSSTGTYPVFLITTNSLGCMDTAVHYPNIGAPAIDFTYSGQCVLSPTQFTALADPNTAATYYWEFGDGMLSNLANPVHTYIFAGNYTVLLTFTDTSGIVTTVTHLVTIYPSPVPNFSVPIIKCAGSAVQFTDMTQINGGSALTGWSWNFGDPGSGSANTSTLQNPQHTFETPGTYNVELFVTTAANCNASLVQQVTINGNPHSDFTFTPPHMYEVVYFTDLSLPGTSGIISYDWDFGNGQTSASQNPSVPYTMPGNYLVTLTVTTSQGCTDQSDSLLVVPEFTDVSGKVIAGDQAVTEAIVSLVQTDSLGMQTGVQQTSPEPDLYYHFPGQAQGDYYLMAYPSPDGPWASAYLPTFYVYELFWQSAYQLQLGTALYNYDIYLEPYSILTGGAYTINGQLSYPGKSISPANQVILLLDDQDHPVRWTLTGPDGIFSFNSLPAGLYKVNPVVVGYTTFPYFVDLNELSNPVFVKMYLTGQIITGTENQTENPGFRLYPNPAREKIMLELTPGFREPVAEIFNSKGMLCSSARIGPNGGSIDLQNLPAGLYIIKLNNTDGTSQQSRFIKE